ncbi:MAG TPA: hypothetical protein VML75_19355 [Kofleriaceae bacterium]|nr:hypothetical protein [Kofleriaceae bacterium]
MSIPDEIAGLTLAQFVGLSARMIGLETTEQCRVVVRDAGVEQAVWEAANQGWSERLGTAGSGSELVATHRRLLIEALRQLSGNREPLPLDRYVDINVLVRSGTPADQAFAAFGETMQSFSASSYEWMDRFARDSWLETYFQLRVQKGVSKRTGRAPREANAVYGPGNLVRGRRCHHCGGLKVTRPSTAYVYCDYCATLFDYDPYVAVSDPTALDPDMVDRQLARVTAEPMRQAVAAGDRVEYGRIARWQTDVATEICPAAYSPRIRDPDYRRRFVDGVLVPWTVATRFDPAAHAQGRRVGEAQQRALHKPTLANFLELLARSQQLWAIEAELLEREGVFAAHPDGLDRGHYLYVNASCFVRPWLAALFEPDQQQLLAAAGVTCEYIAMPKVDMCTRGCGGCGQELSIPVGSKRFVCESCGFVLDILNRAFPCAGCGGSVCLPDRATDAICAYCGAHWTL